MKTVKIILFSSIIILILCAGLRWYVGGLTQIQIKEKEMGPYTFAYLSFTGSYYKVEPTMNTINQALKEDGINAGTGLGIYYDNPAKTPKDELRSEIGSIIDSKDIGKLKGNSNKYLIKTIPVSKYIVATFPIKNKFSYMIGPMIVYPKVTKYITGKKYNAMNETMELYDMTNKTTYYLVKI